MASKLLHRILTFDFFDLWPWFLTYIVYFAEKCYSFAISNPILISFALCDNTRWGLKNYYTEFCPLTFDIDSWPILYILRKNATPSPFLTQFWFHLLYVISLGKGLKNLLLLLLLLKWNIYLWLQQTHWCQSKDLHFRRVHILSTV